MFSLHPPTRQVLDPTTTATCVATNLAFAQHKIPYTDLGGGKVVPTLKHKVRGRCKLAAETLGAEAEAGVERREMHDTT